MAARGVRLFLSCIIKKKMSTEIMVILVVSQEFISSTSPLFNMSWTY